MNGTQNQVSTRGDDAMIHAESFTTSVVSVTPTVEELGVVIDNVAALKRGTCRGSIT
jgi:hypothetical protein